ncbi:unnamed protein product [Macrosiphum euphorbiae]|uniref:Reverse transcriptase n=1 Tax=Macrosiphum euphorbiae TaxID=13131 RepID=A0AAV0WTT2_9HEMI|nr:unnamed protein product [Macrosiphum euphorbiae]
MQERLCVDPKSFLGIHSKESKVSSDQVAFLFASHFSSVYGVPRFTSNDLSDEFTNHQFSFLLSNLSISIDDFNVALNSLSNCSGPDGISAILLYHCYASLSLPVTLIFNQSLLEGVFSSVWKISRVTPMLRSGNSAGVANYRPISGLPLLGLVLESHFYYGLVPTLVSVDNLSTFLVSHLSSSEHRPEFHKIVI